MKKLIIFALFFGLAALPATAFASNLTAFQVQSIIGLLEAFQVDEITIQNVYYALVSYGDDPAPTPETTYQPTQPTESPVLGSIVADPVVQKEMMVNVDTCNVNMNGRYCDISVFYYENGKRVDTDSVSISADDFGSFIGTKPVNRPACSGGIAANTDGTQVMGSSISCPTRYSVKDGKPVAYFTYFPSELGSRIITASANGISGSTTCLGAVE